MPDVNDPAAFSHHHIDVNGIALHYVAQGEGPLVLMLHGFPYTWFEWRHQIHALAAAGFRVVAPDIRGFGQSAKPDVIAQYTLLHSAGDAVGLVAALGADRAFLVGHDLGAWIAAAAARLRPDVFPALALISTALGAREAVRPSTAWAAIEAQGEGQLYHHYFQAPGVAEAELDADIAATLRGIYHAISGMAKGAERWRLLIRPGERLLDTFPDPGHVPAFLTADAFAEYVRHYRKGGFAAPLAHYRCRDLNWDLTAAWVGQTIDQPSLFIGGAADPALDVMRPAYDALAQTYTRLAHKTLLAGVGHGAPEEAPEAVSRLLIDFLSLQEAH
jgi:pimeloyl-ACP methyl ester carboxylesterase